MPADDGFSQQHRERRLIRAYLLLTVSNLLIFTSIHIFLPSLSANLVKEDHLLENLTAGLFFGGFLLGLFFVRKLKGQRYRMAYFAIPLLALLCFLEEISYGERLLGFERLRIYLPGGRAKGFQVDTVHSVAYAFYRVYGAYFLYPLVAAFGIVFLLAIRKYKTRLFRVSSPFAFALISVALLFLGEIIDATGRGPTVLLVKLGFIKGVAQYQQTRMFINFLEELSELNAALALLFASLFIRHRTS